jgi:nitrite reductase (NO-forming)
MVRYYAVAFFLFVLTCLIGGLLAYEMMASRVPAWLVAYADGIAVAHSIIGVGGWAGITILGTVVTLGLSMLHARQDSRALTSAQSALPLFLAAVVVASIGGVAGLPIMVGCGVLAFLAAAVGGIVAPLWRSFGVRKRSSHAVWPLLAGLVWTIVLLAAFAVEAFVAESVSVVRTEIIDQLGVFLAAGIGQIFVASLAYLVPVAIGGGPTVQRVGDVAVSFLWPVRLMVRNAALVLLLLGGAVGGGISGTVRTYLLVIVVATYAVDVVLVAFSAVRQLIAKRTKLEAKAIAKGRNMTMMKSTEKKAEGGND